MIKILGILAIGIVMGLFIQKQKGLIKINNKLMTWSILHKEGATSMDTTLSIIVKYTGKEWAMILLFRGIVLTIIVPFLVTFMLEAF